jgi:ribosomal protein L29
MKSTNQICGSNQDQIAPREPHPWLQKHYQEKRERTVRLVKAAVDQLVKEKQPVTIEAICHKSAQIDSEGRGVKKSTLLENEDAHAYYRTHSASYRAAASRKRPGRGQKAARPLSLPRIDPQRNQDRARHRCTQMTKAELVERLLNTEQAYADLTQQLAHVQFKLSDLQQQVDEARRQGR